MDTEGFEGRVKQAFGGVSVAQIAESMEVNHHTLRNWLKGRTDIPPSELAKIATLTECSLNWLLTGEGEKYASPAPRMIEKPVMSELELFLRRTMREEFEALFEQAMKRREREWQKKAA